ncbi:hypothetical protein Pan153_62300 [Gimesia panareensis]|uniref:Outer membrane lipoprotein-sorting protein n=1 Tax=Gimesia panareensis TaxID=2527978 RepID=A0A518FZ43_9PLAN|nr:hypothetical protein [Gimesia panareensis]QDV21540.1 hypothetical protein Pan153_62300 [Gimesia panareensis]
MSARLILILAFLITLTSQAKIYATDPAPQPKRELNAEETEQVLEFLSQELTKKFDAIHTWQGTYQFTDETNSENPRSTTGGRYWKTTQGQYTFWLDEIQDRLRVNYDKTEKPNEFNQFGTLEPVKTDSPTNTQWIVTGLDCYELSEERFGSVKGFPEGILLKGSTGRVLFRKPRFEEFLGNRFFDPRDLFGGKSYPSVRNPQIYLAALRGEHGDELQQKYARQLSITELQGESGQKQYQLKLESTSKNREGLSSYTRTTYDSHAGWNVTHYEDHLGSKVIHKRTILYKNVDGIYLPQEVDIAHFKQDRTRRADPYHRQNYRLVESKLNQPLDRSLFEIKSLQLKPGERMVDQIRSKAFVQYENRLVPASQYPLLIK